MTMAIALEPVAKTFVSDGLTLSYLDWGNEDAPVLILVHGIRDHARSWDWVARALQSEWRVIALDLRGHGDSDWSPDGAYLTPYHLLDFIHLVEALECDTVTIVAHSFGGNPAVRYAALYPGRVERLVLVDAMGPNGPVIARWDELGPLQRTREWLDKQQAASARPARRFATLDEAIARMAKANPHLSTEQARHLGIHGVREFDDGFGWKYDPRVGNFLPEDFAVHLSAYWRDITAPTLICWGSESWTTNPATDGASDHFRNVQNVAFAQAGHWIHHDRFDEFVGVLREFLDR